MGIKMIKVGEIMYMGSGWIEIVYGNRIILGRDMKVIFKYLEGFWME